MYFIILCSNINQSLYASECAELVNTPESSTPLPEFPTLLPAIPQGLSGEPSSDSSDPVWSPSSSSSFWFDLDSVEALESVVVICRWCWHDSLSAAEDTSRRDWLLSAESLTASCSCVGEQLVELLKIQIASLCYSIITEVIINFKRLGQKLIQVYKWLQKCNPSQPEHVQSSRRGVDAGKGESLFSILLFLLLPSDCARVWQDRHRVLVSCNHNYCMHIHTSMVDSLNQSYWPLVI